ncbi:hypothetical protein GWK47_039183 [Chionoecetes opilio]|uniref:MADF domain-containing protein n=1 Tax=Chionoecetes opilio TaxID=41210 RepID=A0A8J5CLR0_CHIOP|nr:hypothetical protein GWK47_039183 [Chionoecetes opilio]
MVWTRISEEFLVERIRDHPCIWDHRSDLYTKKALKRAAYVAMKNILVDNFPELATITTDHVRIKYNNLRTYFLKELKKTVDASSGSAGGYVTRWELFGVMSFLKDTLYNYITVPTQHFREELLFTIITNILRPIIILYIFISTVTISFMQHTVTTSTITIIISCRQHRNTTTVTVLQLTSRAKPVKPAKEEEN